jgi:hypothetical protein
MDAEEGKDLETLEPSEAPEESEATRRTLLQLLEERSDAEVTALTADRLAFDMDFLLEALVDEVAQHKVAANELRATERLRRLAMKHEDLRLAQGLSEDAAYLQTVVPVYAARCGRYRRQWQRHWDALLKHKIPDTLYDALEAIAAAEHCTLSEQIITLLRAGVAQWQAQHPPS